VATPNKPLRFYLLRVMSEGKKKGEKGEIVRKKERLVEKAWTSSKTLSIPFSTPGELT